MPVTSAPPPAELLWIGRFAIWPKRPVFTGIQSIILKLAATVGTRSRYKKSKKFLWLPEWNLSTRTEGAQVCDLCKRQRIKN